MEYSSTAWEPFYQYTIDWLERVQRRAARFMFNYYKTISTATSMVSQIGWKTIAERRREHRISQPYKIINVLVAIPADTHLHFNTRNIQVTQATQTPSNILFSATIRDWNLLPDDVVDCLNLSTFNDTMGKSRD